MELSRFVDQVADMRQAQKEYFSARKSKKDKLTIGKALNKSILLEIAVDTTIREFRIRRAEKVLNELAQRCKKS